MTFQEVRATASKQFVFGARGRNDLVFRDKIGGSPVRQYALCDNMGSKVAITDDTGTIQERYAFSAFGDLEVMDASYNPRTTSFYDWETLFHGEVRDTETGYYNYGYRYYLPQLGRWPSRDPIGAPEFRTSPKASLTPLISMYELLDLYSFAKNDGVNHFDSLGLKIFPPCTSEILWCVGGCLSVPFACNPASLATGLGVAACIGALLGGAGAGCVAAADCIDDNYGKKPPLG